MTWNCDGKNQNANTSQHAVDHGRRNGAEPLAQLQQPGEHLNEPGEKYDDADRSARPTFHELPDENREPGRGPATCSGDPASEPTTMPPMMPVISPAVRGMPRRDRNAHAQRQCDEKYDNGRQQIAAERTFAITWRRVLPVASASVDAMIIFRAGQHWLTAECTLPRYISIVCHRTSPAQSPFRGGR